MWVGKTRIATISNKIISTSISVSSLLSYTYSYKYFNFFYFIFSSLVSVHIMVYKLTSVSNFLGVKKIEIEEEVILFENIAIRIFP